MGNQNPIWSWRNLLIPKSVSLLTRTLGHGLRILPLGRTEIGLLGVNDQHRDRRVIERARDFLTCVDVSRGSATRTGSREPARPSSPAVAVTDLVKRYPKSPINAVDGISFEVAPGEVFGLLGPNGAGKTTTVGMLTTRVRPTSGQAMVGTIDVVSDPVHARGQLAVVPQRSNLDRSISIRRNLRFHAAYHGVPAAEAESRADQLLEQFGLRERGDTKPDFFSGGQAQRVMIARALMHQPQVLFLDEPTTGLDPAARLFVWDRLRELRTAGVTIILTTHDMHEAATLADRVGIMDHGKPTVSQARAFRAVLRRDVFVTWSELPVFLAQVILQPLFLLFVFGKVLGSLGYTRGGYADLLFPGLLALTSVITSMQTLSCRTASTSCSRWCSRRCCSPAVASTRGRRCRGSSGFRSSPPPTR